MDETQRIRLRRKETVGRGIGLLMFIMLAAVPAGTFAQAAPSWLEETMFASGKINTVVAVVSVVLLGLAGWMFAMDVKLRKLEKRIRK